MNAYKILLLASCLLMCGCSSNTLGSESPSEITLDPLDRSSDTAFEESILKYIKEDINDDYVNFQPFSALYFVVSGVDESHVSYTEYNEDLSVWRTPTILYGRGFNSENSMSYFIDTRFGIIQASQLNIGDILIAKTTWSQHGTLPYQVKAYRLFLVGHED